MKKIFMFIALCFVSIASFGQISLGKSSFEYGSIKWKLFAIHENAYLYESEEFILNIDGEKYISYLGCEFLNKMSKKYKTNYNSYVEIHDFKTKRFNVEYNIRFQQTWTIIDEYAVQVIYYSRYYSSDNYIYEKTKPITPFGNYYVKKIFLVLYLKEQLYLKDAITQCEMREHEEKKKLKEQEIEKRIKSIDDNI